MSSTDRPNLSPHLQQALSMLDLNPEQELARYRRYKNGESEAVKTFESAELIEVRAGGNRPLPGTFSAQGVVNMADDDEEEYEVIPPSQSFAVYEQEATNELASPVKSTPLDNEMPAGEMVLTSPPPVSENLNLSLRTPGEITPRAEYLPASQELLRSLGSHQLPAAEIPIPKWKMPLAIGSSLVAVAAVSGMSYVNMHPALLKGVPAVSQLTAPPVLPVVPPGEALQGPNLGMGYFNDLSLSNINSISSPGADLAKATAPPATTGIAPTAPTAVAPPIGTPPASVIVPGTPGAAPAPAGRLSDGLIRNLLPPSIQQFNSPAAPPSNNLPIQQYFRPSAASAPVPKNSAAGVIKKTPNQC
jgi:hypothetical protein